MAIEIVERFYLPPRRSWQDRNYRDIRIGPPVLKGKRLERVKKQCPSLIEERVINPEVTAE